MTLNPILPAIAAVAILCNGVPARAADFLEKRACTVDRGKTVPVHTTCIVSGGMSNGQIDAEAKTPDGKTYTFEGYLDRKDGWRLTGKPARQTSASAGEFPICVKTTKGSLELCLEGKVD